MKNVFLLILFIATHGLVSSQSLEDILISVSRKNLELLSDSEINKAEKLDNLTGIYLSDPRVEFAYLPSVKDKGKMQVWSVSQELNFPGGVKREKVLAGIKNQHLDLLLDLKRQELLLDASKTYIVLVALNQLKSSMVLRMKRIDKLVKSYRKKLSLGEASKLEINKLLIEQSQLGRQMNIVNSEIEKETLHLSQLNGGELTYVTEETFPILIIEVEAMVLEKFKANSVEYRILKLQQEQASARSNLVKNKVMPGLIMGFESEKSPDGNFMGPSIGVSIPLWERKNLLQAAKVREAAVETKSRSTEQLLIMSLKQKYVQVKLLEENVNLLSVALSNDNSLDLLDRALELGELDMVDYLREVEWVYDLSDELIQLEKEYVLAKAELLRFLL